MRLRGRTCAEAHFCSSMAWGPRHVVWVAALREPRSSLHSQCGPCAGQEVRWAVVWFTHCSTTHPGITSWKNIARSSRSPPTSTPRATVRERCHMVIISRSWSTWLLRYLGTSLPYRECTARRPTRGSSISADPLSRLPDTLSAPLASDPIGDRYAGPIPNSYPPPHSLPFHKAPPSRLKDPCGPVAD